MPLVLIKVSFVPLYKEAPLIDGIERFMTECGYRRYAHYPSDQPDHWGDALIVKA